MKNLNNLLRNWNQRRRNRNTCCNESMPFTEYEGISYICYHELKAPETYRCLGRCNECGYGTPLQKVKLSTVNGKNQFWSDDEP